MSEEGRYKKIIVPLDGSGWSERAIPHAVDIARNNHAELILLHVFKPPANEYVGDLALAGQDESLMALREAMKQKLMALRGTIRGEKVNVRVQVIEGTGVAAIICDYINEEGADLVVMSSHGRTGVTRWLFGSVAHKVMQGVNVPVMIIRPEKDQA
ncbi:MAG: universal stress protein [Anaerolineae bacterium]